MTIIRECIKARSQITQLSLLNNSIAYTTIFHGVELFSHENCEINLNFSSEHLNTQTTATTFSPDGLYFGVCTNNIIYLFALKSKELIRTISSIEVPIVLLTFDPTSAYLIVGTKDGRVLQYKQSDSTLLARVISYKYQRVSNNHNSILSSISFYKEYLVSAYYDGSINIINIYAKTPAVALHHSNCSINATCMLDNETLVSGTSNGLLYIQNINSKEAPKEISTPFTSISQIILMPNPNYLLISSSTNFVTLINLKKNKIEHTKFASFKEDIFKIVLIDQETLIVALIDNTIVRVELPSLKQLKSLMLHNSLDEAFELTEQNHMLYETQEYNSLQLHYRKTYLNAIEALVNQNKNAALALTDMFKNTSSKKEEIKLLYKAFDNYSRFEALFLDKKYAVAYNLSAKFPALQLTHQYRQMEKIFKTIFLNAQRHIVLGNMQSARALLSEYITVSSKRALIKLILDDNKLFVEFLKATQEQDFTKINALAKKNSILMQVPTYKVLEDSTESQFSSIEIKIREGELQEAKAAIAMIKRSPALLATISRLTDQCNTMQRLQKVYDNGDFQSSYEILDSNPYLSSTKLGKMLHKHWTQIILKCEDFALNGNIKGVKTTLKELISVHSRKEKVGDLLRVSFHVKIKQLLKSQKYKSAENIIYSYLDIFGKDSEMSYIMKQYEQITGNSLAITQNIKIPRDSWLYSEIIMK